MFEAAIAGRWYKWSMASDPTATRFDFPGTAADEPQVGSKKPLFAPLTLSERAVARVTLQLPHSPRVRRAVLVDRGLNTAAEIAWPLPDVPKGPPAAASSAVAPQP